MLRSLNVATGILRRAPYLLRCDRQYARKAKKKAYDEHAGKKSALEEAVRRIEGSYGKGSMIKLGDQQAPNLSEDDVVPTGSLTLDIAMGVGGLPRGRIVEIYGPEASGKTTLALSAIAQAQKRGLTCTFIDAEHALDVKYTKILGVDLNELYISQPSSGEQALEIADTLVRSGGMDVIVVDSVAALVPRAELDGEMGDHHIGLQARLMSQALRKMTNSLSKSNTLLIFINQIRMKVGVIFGSPEVTAGGMGLKFYSSARIEIRKSSPVKVGETAVGTSVKVKVTKNKVGPPYRTAEFDIMFGEGISRMGELVDLGCEAGFLQKSGAWYQYKGESIAQGREKAKAYFAEHKDLAEELETLIRDHHFGWRQELPDEDGSVDDSTLDKVEDL